MGSRLFVNNLPKHVDQDKLRQHFAQQGDVTDCKVMKSKDGSSRGFGFVGFKTPEQAQAALKYFNRSFIGSSRLAISMAETFSDVDKSKAKGRAARLLAKQSGTAAARASKVVHAASQAQDTNDNDTAQVGRKRKQRSDGADQAAEQVGEDAKRSEFFALMRPNSASRTYGNGEAAPAPAAASAGATASAHAKHKAVRGSVQQGAQAPHAEAHDSSAESDADMFPHHEAAEEDVSDLEYLRRKKQAAAASEAIAVPAPAQQPGAPAAAGAKKLSRKQRRLRRLAAEAAAAAGADPPSAAQAPAVAGAAAGAPQGAQASEAQRAQAAEAAAAQVAETGRLFIRNLPFVTTDDDILQLCAPFGPVTDATVVKSKATGESKGFAVVTYASPPDAVAAFRALDASIFQGRLLHVLPGRPLRTKQDAPSGSADQQAEAASGGQALQPAAAAAVDSERSTRAGGAALSSFKAARDAQRKRQAGNRQAWSTLYMRDDTVAEAAAALMGVGKADLVGADAENAAVQVALAEAQVLATTKAELQQAGVNVEALEAAAAASGSAATEVAVPRSDTALLLKNLPYIATEEALQALFQPFGGARRLVLPATKVLALVELADKKAAKAAFAGLAYKRFHHVPLYLEYAPRGIFDAPAADAAQLAAQPAVPAAGEASAAQSQAAAQQGSEAGDDGSADSATLYIKNVSFTTTQDALRTLFDQTASACGGMLRAVRMVMHTRPDGKVVPKGFAFAELDSHDTARSVLAKVQGRVLDGHALQLELSARKGLATPSAKAKSKENQSSTKVMVRNLAFEATAAEVRTLMEAFGTVKTCRLPKKFDGTNRGFAFVEFLDKSDAKNAVRGVSGTHLYGRRLLLEYAQADEGIEELRQKAAARLQGQ